MIIVNHIYHNHYAYPIPTLNHLVVDLMPNASTFFADNATVLTVATSDPGLPGAVRLVLGQRRVERH